MPLAQACPHLSGMEIPRSNGELRGSCLSVVYTAVDQANWYRNIAPHPPCRRPSFACSSEKNYSFLSQIITISLSELVVSNQITSLRLKDLV